VANKKRKGPNDINNKRKDRNYKKVTTPKSEERPLRDVDLALVRDLAKIHCTYDEIAAVLGVSLKIIEHRLVDIIDQARNEGRSSLRRAMWNVAVNKGNVSMLIWLSKNLLNFSDKHYLESKPTDSNENSRLVVDFGELKKPYKNDASKELAYSVKNDPETYKNRINDAMADEEEMTKAGEDEI
jgi:hypothetical protein